MDSPIDAGMRDFVVRRLMTTPIAMGLIFAPHLSSAMRLAAEIGWPTSDEKSLASNFFTTRVRSSRPEKSV